MKLKCECCGIEREFVDGEEAFQAGWDAPPHFVGYVVCDRCPASFVVFAKIKRQLPVDKQKEI